MSSNEFADKTMSSGAGSITYSCCFLWSETEKTAENQKVIKLTEEQPKEDDQKDKTKVRLGGEAILACEEANESWEFDVPILPIFTPFLNS